MEVRRHHAAEGPTFPRRKREGRLPYVTGVRRHHGNTGSVVLVCSYIGNLEVEAAQSPLGMVKEEIELSMLLPAQSVRHQAAHADYLDVAGG